MSNPFAAVSVEQTATALAESDRAVAEVQASLVIAKRYPRDQRAAMDRILQACSRPTLAEVSEYAYSRGGQQITGPSIRLAEVIAQGWGNMHCGIREVSQRDGVSEMQAHAWDLETNTYVSTTFHVRHERRTKKTTKVLDDPRDIYEHTANMGSRRLRACILRVIPIDVVEAARDQCAVTLQNAETASPERVSKLVDAFGELGITKDMLSARLGGKHLDAIISAEVIQLRRIYQSLRDGMSKPADWFDVPKPDDEAAAALTEQLTAPVEAVEEPSK